MAHSHINGFIRFRKAGVPVPNIIFSSFSGSMARQSLGPVESMTIHDEDEKLKVMFMSFSRFFIGGNRPDTTTLDISFGTPTPSITDSAWMIKLWPNKCDKKAFLSLNFIPWTNRWYKIKPATGPSSPVSFFWTIPGKPQNVYLSQSMLIVVEGVLTFCGWFSVILRAGLQKQRSIKGVEITWNFNVSEIKVKKQNQKHWTGKKSDAKHCRIAHKVQMPTLPETNIFAPKNGWLEYYFPIGVSAYFQGRCPVSLRGGTPTFLQVSHNIWVVQPTLNFQGPRLKTQDSFVTTCSSKKLLQLTQRRGLLRTSALRTHLGNSVWHVPSMAMVFTYYTSIYMIIIYIIIYLCILMHFIFLWYFRNNMALFPLHTISHIRIRKRIRTKVGKYWNWQYFLSATTPMLRWSWVTNACRVACSEVTRKRKASRSATCPKQGADPFPSLHWLDGCVSNTISPSDLKLWLKSLF